MKLDLQATPEEVMRAVEALQEFGRQEQLADKEVFGLALALEECACNIVNHAYRRDPNRQFRVIIEHTGNSVTLELRDRGPEFDPTLVPSAEPQANDGERPPGGWGIQLVRKYIDHVRYQRQNDENVLRLTKRLN